MNHTQKLQQWVDNEKKENGLVSMKIDVLSYDGTEEQREKICKSVLYALKQESMGKYKVIEEL